MDEQKHLARPHEDDVDDDVDGDDDDFIGKEDHAAMTSKVPALWWDDFYQALYEARVAAPFVALLAFLLAYQLTIAPYRVTIDQTVKEPSHALHELSSMRPVLTGNEMASIQKTTLYAETSFVLPSPSADTIKIKFYQSVNKHGNHRLPAFFYDGVTFGISSENPHKLEFTAQNYFTAQQLKADLMGLPVKPTAIMDRWATFNDTVWNERGFGVFFSYDDLSRTGRLSSDILQPWKRILEDMLALARRYKQIYITVWYPHQFGGFRRRSSQQADLLIEKDSVVPIPLTTATFTELGDDDTKIIHHQQRFLKEFHENYRHINIIQQIIPTRTGLNGIKSSAAVWVAAINDTEPFSLQQKLPRDW